MAGFQVPADTRILVVELKGVGKEHPLSAEKLSPVLSLFFVKDFAASLDTAEAILRFGGLGHTCGIYSKDDARIREFAMRMPAMRVLCNTPTPQGSVGITTNLLPSMTLGCGAVAGNITGDNIGAKHLINIKRLAYAVRKPEEAFEVPLPKVFAQAATTATSVPATIDRGTVISAVERYLAQRGLATLPAAEGKAGSVADVVDRFLTQKRPSPSANIPPAKPETVAKAPAPTVPIADFVCENDVRAALTKSQKIYIGPKTILTPSARDLGNQHDIFVTAQR
jgi:acetaldehyde dehydrogenase (acetylating)